MQDSSVGPTPLPSVPFHLAQAQSHGPTRLHRKLGNIVKLYVQKKRKRIGESRPISASPTSKPECLCFPLELVMSHLQGRDQFSSVAQSFLTLCNPMDCSTPSFPVHHQVLELAQTHVHQVCDPIQPSHPLSFPFPLAFNLSQGLLQ